MKRCILYIFIVAAVLALPKEPADVADLRPVQTVACYMTEGEYRIETDAGDYGVGRSVDDAYKNLIATTPGVIYLDTADYLLISEDAQAKIPQIGKYLKSNVGICMASGQCDLVAAGKFLSVHGNLPSISQWKNGLELPVLDCTSERIKLL